MLKITLTDYCNLNTTGNVNQTFTAFPACRPKWKPGGYTRFSLINLYKAGVDIEKVMPKSVENIVVEEKAEEDVVFEFVEENAEFPGGIRAYSWQHAQPPCQDRHHRKI